MRASAHALIPGDAPFNIDDNHEITIDDNDDSSS
jgi:hypothetical protein